MLLPKRLTLICCFIFQTSFGMVTSGNTKHVHRGEPVQLSSYSDISNCTEVSLYINGEKNLALIATWKLEICTPEVLHMNSEYQERIDMDIYGNVWIWKVSESDAAKYYIKCDRQNSSLEVELTVSKELTKQDQIQKCQPDATCIKNCLGIKYSTTMLTGQKKITEETSYHTTITLDRVKSTEENLMKEIMPLLSICIYNPVTIAILVIVVLIAVVDVVYIFWKCACCQCKKNSCYKCKKNPCYQCKKKNIQGDDVQLLECFRPQKKHVVSDVDKLSLSLKWRFSGGTQGNARKPWLLDLVFNPDHDLIVTDGENNELKKFSLQGKLKRTLSFKTRPDCLALTDGYHVTVTFPSESVLRVVDTRDELCIVSEVEFRSKCAGIGSMEDGRLIISNRDSRSVIVRSKDGEILQEIKTGSSGEKLFRKPSYVRVVNNRTIYVSDYRSKEFFIIDIDDDNTFTVNKHPISYPRTSCVVDSMLLVAASNIRLFTLDGNEAGEIPLDGVHHVRGLAFSEGKRLLAITHQSDADEEISVYEVKKH